MKKWAVGLLAAALCAAEAWAGTVTYTVTGTNSVEVSGDVPQGAGAVYASSGSQKFRLTAGNSMTLTLSGYEGFAITNLVLEMKSNKSAGAGSLLVECGEAVIAEIGKAGFDSDYWHGAFSTNWVEVSPDVRATTIDREVVISIDASESSLYCQSFTIGYAAADTGAVALPFLAYNGPWEGVAGFASKGVVDLEDSVEFDDTGDWLRIRFDGVPGQVAYEIDEFNFNENAAFLVQESADGERWTTLSTWKVQEPTHYHQVAYHELSGASQYVRFFFETKGGDGADVRISNVSITEGGPVWPVTVAEGIANGSIAVDRDVAKEGETVTVSATADPGYKLDFLSLNGESLGHGATTFEMPGGGAEVSATFAADWVTLPFPEGQPYQGPWTDDEIGFATEGVVDRGEDVKFDDAGDWLQIRFDEVPGMLSYVIGDFMFYENVPSTFLVQESTDGERWTTLTTWVSYQPAHDIGPSSVAAYHELSGASRYVRFFFESKGEDGAEAWISKVSITAGGLAWPITVAEGIANGTVAVDKTSAKEGETVTVTSTPAAGCRLESISVNGTSLESGETTFEMPGEAVEVSASFAEVKDSATLPFIAEGKPYEGPWKGAAVDGLSSQGLDADYADGAAKFDSEGDWMQIRFTGTPGQLVYGIKGYRLSADNPSTFLVQESADGTNWMALATWVSGELGNTQTMATNDLASDTRCVRFFYATKGAGNVGISSVYITAGETEPPSIAYTGETVVAPGGTFSIAFTLENYDAPFTWALTAGNGTLDSDGNYTWTPDETGIYPITVAAQADGGTVASLSLRLEVVTEPGPGPTPVQVHLTSIRVEDLETDGALLRRVTLTIDNPDVQFMVKRTYDLGTATTPAVWTNVNPTAHFTGGTATFDEPGSRVYYRVDESE